MTDIFYYIGIPYIIWEIVSMILTTRHNEDSEKEIVAGLTSGLPSKIEETDMENLSKSVGAVKELTIKKFFGIITGFFFLVWMIAGYLYSHESNIFLFILILSFATTVIPMIVMVVYVFKSRDIKGTAVKSGETLIKKSKSLVIF